MIVVPAPRQFGQVCWIEKKPCCMRTWPVPPQVLQVLGSLPGLAPEPARRCSHSAMVGMLMLTVSAEHRLLQIQGQVVAQVRATVDVAAGTAAAAAEDVAEDVTENVAERIAGFAARAAHAGAASTRHGRTVVGGTLVAGR